MQRGPFPHLAAVRPDPWWRLKQAARRRTFHRGEVLFQAGRPADELYLLERGRIRLFSRSPQGRRLTLSVVEPGDIFGEQALFPRGARTSHAQALTDGVLYALSRQRLEELLWEDPTLVLQVLENLGKRLRSVERRLGDLVFKSAPERLAALLLDMVDPRVRQSSGPTWLPFRYTHQQFAEMINTHRETVTKIFSRFRDDRLLDFDRDQIVLLDMERLREMSLR